MRSSAWREAVKILWSMFEVAIRAVEEVFDWKAYLEENFSKTEESFGENKCTQEECAL
jgi:hypothetical protein